MRGFDPQLAVVLALLTVVLEADFRISEFWVGVFLPVVGTGPSCVRFVHLLNSLSWRASGIALVLSASASPLAVKNFSS